jgi:hypothetical protein
MHKKVFQFAEIAIGNFFYLILDRYSNVRRNKELTNDSPVPDLTEIVFHSYSLRYIDSNQCEL